MSRRRVLRVTSFVACALLVLASCSDDGGGEGAATTSTTVATPASSAPPTTDTAPSTTRREIDPASEAAMERAEALNLGIDDFPSGWQNLPQAESEVGVIELCTTVDLYAHLVALARSDAFTYTIEPGTLQASSSVTVVDDEAQAIAMIDDFRQDSFVQCATDILRRDTDTYTVSGALSRNDTEPGIGDEAVALSGEFTITPADGSPAHSLSAIVVAARRGDTVVIFNSTATDRGFEEETTRGLLTTLAQRLEA